MPTNRHLKDVVIAVLEFDRSLCPQDPDQGFGFQS